MSFSAPKFVRNLIWTVACVAMIVFVAKFDVAAIALGVSLYAVYAFPVAIMGWRLGRIAALLFSAFATSAWLKSDFAAQHVFKATWIVWEVGINRFVLFFFIGYSFDWFRRAQMRDQGRLRDLEAVVPMCAVCHRIKNDKSEWVDFEIHLQRQRAEMNRRLCSDCAKVKYVSELTL